MELPEIVEEHERLVLKTAYRILQNWEDAQDAAQEVFLRVQRADSSFDDSCEVGPWLYRITVNVARDQLRRKRPNIALTDGFDVADGHPGPEELARLEQQRRILHDAIEQLPRQQRAAILLREIEGLSTDEVASRMGATASTVRSQVSIGKARLRRILLASTTFLGLLTIAGFWVRTVLLYQSIEWPSLSAPAAQMPLAPLDRSRPFATRTARRTPRNEFPPQTVPSPGLIRFETADETVVIYWLVDDPRPRKGEEE